MQYRPQAYSEAALRSHRMPEKAPPLGPQPFAGLLVDGGLVLHPQRYLLCVDWPYRCRLPSDDAGHWRCWHLVAQRSLSSS